MESGAGNASGWKTVETDTTSSGSAEAVGARKVNAFDRADDDGESCQLLRNCRCFETKIDAPSIPGTHARQNWQTLRKKLLD